MKGKNKADLGMGQKRALEKILDKKAKAITKLSKKMLRIVRQKEMMKGKKKPMTKANKKRYLKNDKDIQRYSNR